MKNLTDKQVIDYLKFIDKVLVGDYDFNEQEQDLLNRINIISQYDPEVKRLMKTLSKEINSSQREKIADDYLKQDDQKPKTR